MKKYESESDDFVKFRKSNTSKLKQKIRDELRNYSHEECRELIGYMRELKATRKNRADLL